MNNLNAGGGAQGHPGSPSKLSKAESVGSGGKQHKNIRFAAGMDEWSVYTRLLDFEAEKKK